MKFQQLPTVLFLSLILISGCGHRDNGGENTAATDSLTLTEEYQDSSLIAPAAVDLDTVEPQGTARIVIDKPNVKLYVIDHNDTIFRTSICAGRVYGDKRSKDDRRTPEGDFKITHIHDATNWLYHTDDGRWVPKVYGPWFLRLDAKGWHGIGVHGTNNPGSMGKRQSKGCIRVKNEDIEKIREWAYVGMPVTILPDPPKYQGPPSTPGSSANSGKSAAPEPPQDKEVAPSSETPQEEALPEIPAPENETSPQPPVEETPSAPVEMKTPASVSESTPA